MDKEIDIQIPLNTRTPAELVEYATRFSQGLDVKIEEFPGVYNVYDLIKTTSSKTRFNPDWGVLSGRMMNAEIAKTCGKTFSDSMNLLKRQLDPEFLEFVNNNAEVLNAIPNPENSNNRQSISVATLLKSYLRRYSLCDNCKKCGSCDNLWVGETIEQMYMRVATFIAMPDVEFIKEVYNALSQNYISAATPTLFNAGAARHQMSSCFVGTVADSLYSIEDYWVAFGEISRNAGGIGCDFSRIRHSNIGAVGKSDGVPALLPIYQSILKYVDQSKKRKGSAAAFIGVWHIDIETFIKMKDPKGADSNSIKCLDLNYGVWSNDLFWERVENDEMWSLFCPANCPELAETYGDEFRKVYLKYESEGKYLKQIHARHLMYEIINAQSATGEPYIMNADMVNICNMQENIGIIRSSNLCMEICLHTSDTEIASCNLASLCLPRFIESRKFDYDNFIRMIRIVVRMLDNVITKNFYPNRELEIQKQNLENLKLALRCWGPLREGMAEHIQSKLITKEILPNIKATNLRNRPIGIGLQGFGDAVAKLDLLFDSDAAFDFNNKIAQYLYYYAVDESCNLARIHGSYPRFPGSPYSKGQLHPDRWVSPEGETAVFLGELDWEGLREKVKGGVRHSTLIAYMPTASTSIIANNSPSMEPINCIIGTKSILSGQHVVLSKETYEDFNALGVWNDDFVNQIVNGNVDKYSVVDGVSGIGGIQHLRVPESIKGDKFARARFIFLKQKYRTAYEMSPKVIIDHAVARTPFTCQSQSMNIFVEEISKRESLKMFVYGRRKGLKTLLYYFRGTAGNSARNISSGCAGGACSS